MRPCSACGRPLGDDSFCSRCGARSSEFDARVPDGDHQPFLSPPRDGIEDTVVRRAADPVPSLHGRAAPGVARIASVRKGPVLVALAGVLAIVLVGLGTAFAVVALVDDETSKTTGAPTNGLTSPGNPAPAPAPTSSARLPTSFVRPPTSQWEVTPSDFLDGESGTFYDARPYGYSELDGAEALYTPDTVVVGVVGSSDETRPRLLGLDPSSGRLRWQFEYAGSEGYASCFSMASKHAVACLGDAQMTTVDTVRSEVSKPVANTATAILDGAGDSIYSVSYESSSADSESDTQALAAVRVEKGTLADPQSGWQRTYPVQSTRGYDGDLAGGETGGRLALDLEGVHLILDSGSGELVEQKVDPQGAEPQAHDAAGEHWQDIDPEPGFTTSGSVRIAFDEGLSDVTATSLGDGAMVWSRSLPDPDLLDDAYGEGFGRSSIGIAGSSVVFSSLLVLEGWTGFGTGTADDMSDEVRYRTPCGEEPDVEAKSATHTAHGVEITLRFGATCPEGQWIDGRTVHLDLSGASGDAIGRAVYDFSRAPVWLPGEDAGSDPGRDGREVTISLPPGAVYALADQIESQITTVVVQCEDSAGSNGTDDAPAEKTADETIRTPYAPGAGDERSNADALAALRSIAAADKAFVDDTLEGQWVPQLSSKENGTTDPLESHTYDYTDILAEHLSLRLAYPDVRLLFSSNWKSFLASGYWVTVDAVPSPGPRTPNAFCDREGFPYSHCYAKLVLREGPAEGSTRHRSD